MRKFGLILLAIILTQSAHAKHICGGEIIYDFLGPGAEPDSKKYRITLLIYRDGNCGDCQAMPPRVTLGIFRTLSRTPNAPDFHFNVLLERTEDMIAGSDPACISNPPGLSYQVGYYPLVVDLKDWYLGYTVSFQTCCRSTDIRNLGPPSGGVPIETWDRSSGSTFVGLIPGFGTAPGGGPTVIRPDRSPRFKQIYSSVCADRKFSLDMSAVDPDGDSLFYSFCTAYLAPGANNSSFNEPGPPLYTPVIYLSDYSGTSPLGSNVSIDPVTGIVTGLAPANPGKYLVKVCAVSMDYSNPAAPKYMTESSKEFIINVAPCDVVGAFLKPSYLFCGGLTVNLENMNASPLNQAFYWDFGDGNTSTQQFPSHTYNNPGDYNVMLIVNPGTSCVDTAYTVVKVYPDFVADFTYPTTTCKDVPVSFTDISTTPFGTINSWRWNIPGLLNSGVQHPVLSSGFPYTGNFRISLIVGTSIGCMDTVIHDIRILDKPPYNLSNDTLICNIDTLQLNFVNNGTATPSLTWSPNYMISNVNSFTPLVSPDITTTYFMNYADNFGCSFRDSVIVRVVSSVNLTGISDTTICLTDSIVLTTNSDALRYNWTPASSLNNATLQSPVATPVLPSTNYHVIASIGKCIAEDDVVITTVPYPAANAGTDSTICIGQSIQLNASGGSIYSWSPRLFLNNSNIANPVSQSPQQDIRYIVTVRDVLGCPKPVSDTMYLTVAKIIADAGPADTNVVLGQPLLLNASGSTNYEWTPSTWLSNPNIFNPVSLPQDDIRYVVRVSNAQGCFDTDTIVVKLFKIDPDLLVPTAFSPDNDGINDIFRPIAIGMKSLDKFAVYNRWGHLMFSTTQPGKGWDGNLKGMPQGAGSYVWEAEGISYLGRKIKKTGSVILIR